MKILALDSSGPNCSVALLDDTTVIANFNLNNGSDYAKMINADYYAKDAMESVRIAQEFFDSKD